MSKQAAFSWEKKGRAMLRDMTCECGGDIVKEVQDIIDVDEDTEVECDDCGRVYESVFLVRMMEKSGPTKDPSEQEDEDEEPEEGDLTSATGLILHGPVDERIGFYYESSISGNTKEVVGTLDETQRGLWARVEAEEGYVADEGDEYEIFGSELSDRDEGDVVKNGRKVGTYEYAEEL